MSAARPAEGEPPLVREVLAERAAYSDAGRPDAVARQHARGGLTARERVERLVDEGSFVEYGMLAAPAVPEMFGPADGVVVGTGLVDAEPVAVVSYDYTVLAATQGQVSHLKVDRVFTLAGRHRWPVVILAEGGGARAQELGLGVGGGPSTFVSLARLSGVVPLAAAVVGPAFAGHANLTGLCDFVVATAEATMGMAGPPLVEAALGQRLAPAEIGPPDVHARAGALDLVVPDDAAAVAALRTYLSYFSGRKPPGEGPRSPEAIRDLVPEDPRQAYDVRRVVEELADRDTVMELRASFARNVLTALVRLGGVTLGVVANQPLVMAGAIDAPASDKIARFVQLCDAFGVPLLFLVDTPGFMVGPAVEESALVRHSARVIHAIAHATVPRFTVVLRKAYGLGYYAMASPPLLPTLLLEWPTAEYGGMGLAGAANILNEGEAEGRAERARELRARHTARAAAARFAVDDLVDPADTRDVLLRALAVLPPASDQRGARPIDPW